ncbi:S-adenosyl-L-methionine-dependent methyltransferase [Massarina eburnea CBS 473.64]|uniref:S-adenosyl-L-methionine-dependent methyltransferase n=1 Tax=Massarina eburnea CBS 473.64 TaxID=1395130 RepID=A0A6A6RYZ7_9PLEO|nr:S-adenosyl-L-methionine-dependent methyltransferase [Massarina eburnea CBS 473.64]
MAVSIPQPIKNGHSCADAVRLLELAKSIAAKAQEVVEGLQQQGLPQPSLGPDGSSPDFIPVLDTRLQEVRRSLVSDARLLADTFTGTRKLIDEQLQFSVHTITVMRILYTFNIPKHVPLDAAISFADVAQSCGLEESRLTRILRYLILNHIFEEPEPGKIAHSAISKFLLSNDAVGMDFIGHMLEEALPSAIGQTDCLKNPPLHSSPVLDCGFAVAVGHSKSSYFDVMAQEPERTKRFGRAMTHMTSSGGHNSIERVLTSYDWAGLGHAKVVDVGGSVGHVAVDLLKYVPALKKVIVQDLPEVIEDARANPIPQVADVADRLEFQGYNFFDPQPIQDADVYLFRHVFHDWPNQKAEEIIRNVVPSMRSGSILIVVEYILYPTGEDDSYSAKMARTADMQMMVLLNAKERSLTDWKELLDIASGGSLAFEQAKGNVLVFRKK